MIRPNQLALLGLLHERPRHAYALHAEIARLRIDRWAPVAFSSVYQVLRALERRGLVAAEEAPSPSGPPRRGYRLTPAGRDALRAALVELLSEPSTPPPIFELALLFRAALPPDALRAALDARRRALRAALDAPAAPADAAWAPYARPVFEHGRRLMEAELAWLDEHAEDLLAGAGP